MSPLLRPGNPLDTRPITAVNTPPKRHRTSPATPRRISAAIPRNGICRQKTGAPYEIPSVPLPASNPVRNAPASLPSDVPNAPLSQTESGALEHLPGFLSPTAARRRALAVILENEHHREPEDLDASAHCAGDKQTSGQLASTQAVPKDSPGLSAPERKARSQKPDVCPRKLWQSSGLSLRATRLAAACRLRRSCHGPRGPVALPRSGCPVRRSRHPAAFAQSLLPATPRGVLRSRSAAPPRPTPAKRRVTFNNNQTITKPRPLCPETA